jgi:Zn-dependent M28 family amino/carboxypeptidase
LSSSEPKKVETLNLENFYGFLEGGAQGANLPLETTKSENNDEDLDLDDEKKETQTTSTSNTSNPIIAIVTYYDSFGITPDMATGLNTNGSGLVTLLELIRILSKFYENYESVIKYDILFVLTSAGNLNFEGTQKLIDGLDPSISENLQYVLCLDTLASLDMNDLYLHISRLPKENEENASRLYKIFTATSENMNFNLNYAKKKIFLTNTVVPWEHEQFSKKKILAGTLSSRENPVVDLFNRTLITDNFVDMSRLKRNIKFLAESLLAFLFDYDIRNFTIFKDDENLLDEAYLETYLNYLKKTSRFQMNIQKGSQFNNDLMNFFNNYLVKTKRQVFEYKDFKFFDSNSGNIKIYSVKSKLIDLYLLLAILFYLFAIYVYTKV